MKDTPCCLGALANVRHDKSLPPYARLLYEDIIASLNEEGYCDMSNSHFAGLYDVTPQAISKWINALAKNNYVRLEYEHNGMEIKCRKIYTQQD